MAEPLTASHEPVLVVVAHPDDEILGFGATAAVLSKAGVPVTACILSGTVQARAQRPTHQQLVADTHEACGRVGMRDPILGEFPNIKMNTVPHLDLVQFIEAAILETGATRLFTHHASDVNDDHRQVCAAALAAARLSQRRSDVPRLRSLHHMEIPSSTDWAFAGGHNFIPDSFVEVRREGLNLKLHALSAYRDVMRPYPHPRSPEAIEALARYRGGQAGMDHAEAFMTAFHDLGAGLL